MDEDSSIRSYSNIKNVLISSGENVPLEELEVLFLHVLEDKQIFENVYIRLFFNFL